MAGPIPSLNLNLCEYSVTENYSYDLEAEMLCSLLTSLKQKQEPHITETLESGPGGPSGGYLLC